MEATQPAVFAKALQSFILICSAGDFIKLLFELTEPFKE